MTSRTLRRTLLTGVAVALLAACSDSGISSPGEGNIGNPTTPTPNPNPNPNPNPTPAADVNLVPAGGCFAGSAQVRVVSGTVDVDVCELTGEIAADVSIPAGVTVALNGPVFIGADQAAPGAVGPTLTVAPGARLVGRSGSDYLVIPRGSKIIADGTASAPIVMTSMADVIAEETGAPRNGAENYSSEWGGLIINGRAPINACIDAAAAGGSAECEKSGEGSSGLYGGAVPNDNSGVLRYVQVRYAGFRITAENELNGIAFQGVGNGTLVDYIQVHNGSDDGVEFFGGTVNAKHIVVTGSEDDSVDWTDGWVGKAQYILVRQRPGAGLADNAFEMDNRGGSNDRLPRSNPTVSNFTAIGHPTSSRGLLYREGTNGRLMNGILTGFGGACLDIDHEATYKALTGNEFQSLYFSCAIPFDTDTDVGGDEETVFFSQSPHNAVGDSTLSGVFPGVNELAVQFTSPADPFFDDVDYIGAFGPTETAENSWASGWTFGVFPETEKTCPTGTTEISGGELQGRKSCRLPSNITSDMTLTAGLNYELSGPVFVGVDMGGDPAAPLLTGIPATLTVEAGAVVYGAAGSDYLVITRGSQLRSNGTRTNPVIFTAKKDLEGPVGANERGLWGGLVINGRAPINACIDASAAGGSADCNKEGEGSSGLYGGNAHDDDSGNIYYTQVKYAGFRITAENELNGVAFQGVGAGTDVDYLQVHNGTDDGVEFFGGTVDARHLVLTGNGDDSLDWTDGWIGRVQYVIVQLGENDGDNAFELDNRSGSNDRLPRSNPTVANITIVGGPTGSNGFLYRAGTNGSLINGVVAGHFNNACLTINDDATFAALEGDEFQSLYFSCDKPFGNARTETAFAAQTSPHNATGASTLSGYSFFPGSLGLVPGANEKAVQATNIADPFFDSVDYVGAVKDESDDWFKGWTYVQQ